MSVVLSGRSKAEILRLLPRTERWHLPGKEWKFLMEKIFDVWRYYQCCHCHHPTSDYIDSEAYDMQFGKRSFSEVLETVFSAGEPMAFYETISPEVLKAVFERYTSSPAPPQTIRDMTFLGLHLTQLVPDAYLTLFPCRRCMQIDQKDWIATSVLECFHIRNRANTSVAITVKFRYVDTVWRSQYDLDFVEFSCGPLSCLPMELALPTKPSKKVVLVREVRTESFRFLPRDALEVCQLACRGWGHSVQWVNSELALRKIASVRFRGQWDRKVLLIITLAEHDVHPKREIFLVGDPQRDSAVLLNHLRNGICTGTMAFESVVGCHATFFSGALQALPDVNFQSKSIVDFIGEMEGVLHSASPELGLRHLCLGVDGSTFDPVVNQLGFFDLTFLQHMTEIDLRMGPGSVIEDDFDLDSEWLWCLFTLPKCTKFRVFYTGGYHEEDRQSFFDLLEHLLFEDSNTPANIVPAIDLCMQHEAIDREDDPYPYELENRTPDVECVSLPGAEQFDRGDWDIYIMESIKADESLSVFVNYPDEHFDSYKFRLRKERYAPPV